MFAPGDLVGSYRVLGPLGSGGMGEVYLAEDTRLRRRVALKVLPADREDERGRRRLLREAQAAATLDHPNICTIYDVGDAGGQSYIAMQYVDGETLAARLERRPPDLREALDIASQIAAALAAAHRQGVVHRDVKPQNVLLTSLGQVKVLDFGIARQTGWSDRSAETATVLTESGGISGTVPYMSPEQARGEPLDARSDVFSFGTLLYELVARRHPFRGGSAADTIAAILTREPAPLPAPVDDPELRRIVGKCLEKDRERRYQTMADLAIDLDNLRRDLGAEPAPGRRAARSPRRARWLAVAAAPVVLAGLAVAWRAGRAAAPRLPVPPADFVQLTELTDSASAPALSPDGRMVAFLRGGQWFLSPGQIYVKVLPNGDPVQLTHDPSFKYAPTFTPDGSRVAYTNVVGVGDSLSWDTWTVPVIGGEPTLLLPNASGLSYLDEGNAVFAEIEAGKGVHMGIVTASLDRRRERRLYFPANERGMAHFAWPSPDRRWLLIAEMDRTGRFLPCRRLPFDGSSSGGAVGPDGKCQAAAWSPDGVWMYFSAVKAGHSHLWRQRFPDGPVEAVTAGVTTDEIGVAVAPDGRSLVTSVGASRDSLWAHAPEGERQLPIDGTALAPRTSRDGRRLYCLVVRQGEARSPRGITVIDLASGATDRWLSEFPVTGFDLARDESQVAFTTETETGEREVWIAAVDRRTPPRRVASGADSAMLAGPGQLVVRLLGEPGNSLARLDVASGRAERLLDRPILDLHGVSPDGAWAVVNARSASGASAPATYAVPVAGGEPRMLCPGACGVAWSPDGRAIYLQGDSIGADSSNFRTVVVPLAAGRAFPDLPPAGLASVLELATLPGARLLPRGDVVPGADPEHYVFARRETFCNLFRVPLP